uniref:RRM domain-containing protein n=1 Tax=Steinernema glaseri TaxID=37863 RepID=A0A1I8A9A3_9BILA
MGRTRSRSCCAVDTQEFSATHYVIASTLIITFVCLSLYVSVVYVPQLLYLLFDIGVRLHNSSFEQKCVAVVATLTAILISMRLIRNLRRPPPGPTAHSIAMSVIDVVCRHRMTGISETMAFEAVCRCNMKEASAEQRQKWKDALTMLRQCEPRVAFDDSTICGLQTLYLTWRQINTNGWEGSVSTNSKRVNEPALSRCMKLRGIFCSAEMDMAAVEKSFIERVYPVFPLHFLILTSSRDGVAYVMLNTLEEAKIVMENVHSHWFNGRIVTAKYVTEQNYIKRFPDTAVYYSS